jgi:hypothetical protein
LVLKIEEINGILAEKYPGMHLKIGSSSVEVLKSGLLHRQELCNIALPFIMPYLQAHQNQAYLVRRIQELSENIALEDFKWNNGGIDFVRDEKNGSVFNF